MLAHLLGHGHSTWLIIFNQPHVLSLLQLGLDNAAGVNPHLRLPITFSATSEKTTIVQWEKRKPCAFIDTLWHLDPAPSALITGLQRKHTCTLIGETQGCAECRQINTPH